jgi:hypothetical protein
MFYNVTGLPLVCSCVPALNRLPCQVWRQGRGIKSKARRFGTGRVCEPWFTFSEKPCRFRQQLLAFCLLFCLRLLGFSTK